MGAWPLCVRHGASSSRLADACDDAPMTLQLLQRACSARQLAIAHVDAWVGLPLGASDDLVRENPHRHDRTLLGRTAPERRYLPSPHRSIDDRVGRVDRVLRGVIQPHRFQRAAGRINLISVRASRRDRRALGRYGFFSLTGRLTHLISPLVGRVRWRGATRRHLQRTRHPRFARASPAEK